MKQILITSTVLIGVILLLRLVLRRRVSKRLIYATWLLVALRLLIPFQFGQSEYSVATVTEKLEQRSEPIQQVQQNLQKPVAGPSREEIYQQLMQDYLSQSQPQSQPQPPTQTPQPEIPTSPTVPPEVHQQLTQEVEKRISAPTPMQILTSVWISGIIVMAGWFLLSNLIFLRRARRGAQSCTDVITPIPIRISDNVSTPCLAGLFRPVIYLTPESAADPQIRDHVLTHELTHLKHADHIWAWVRCLCLCVYWFNPLVWIAAIASKRDCELACDEAALKTLGDGQRIAYGKTLLATVTHSPIHVFQAATAMSESKKQLKERVNFIVKKPKNLLIAAVCLILVVTITAGLVFTGCKSAPEPTTPTTSTEAPEPTQPNPIVITPEMPTEDDLLDLLHYSAQMVENNDTITLNSHWLVKSYLHFNKLPPEVLTISDDIITIKTRMTHLGTDATEDIIIYATFLALLAKQYPDDFTDMDIHYEPTFGRGPFYDALFYTGWKEAGYDSIKDYYAAIDAGEVEMPQNAFIIGYQYHSISPACNRSKNIYEIFFAPDSPQIDTFNPALDNLPCTKDSVDNFMAILTAAQANGMISGVNFDEESCYNVTPAAVAEATDIQIFKFSDTCASFALIDGAVYEICFSFGGLGFVNAVPWDYDGDGNLDLLVASSWGSGMHYAVVTIFNTITKESIPVYTSTNDGDLIVQEIPYNNTKLYAILATKIRINTHLADLSCLATNLIGFVQTENGTLTFINKDIYDFPNSLGNQTPDAAPSDALSIAEKAVDDFLWYRVVGVCCDYEYVHADMSRYLTNDQKQEGYFNIQYKLTCCHTADEVRNHIDRSIGLELQNRGYPDDILFNDDAGNLYLIVTPTDYNGFRHIDVLSESDDTISVRACQYDDDSCYLSFIFSLNATASGYRVTAVTQDDDYECIPQIVNQGPTYMVLKYGAFSYGYQLYDTNGSLKVNESTGFRCPTVTPLSTHVTEIMLNYGTGITQRIFWDTQTLTCSGPYYYGIAVGNGKIAYLDGDLADRVLVVCDIFNPSNAQTFTDLGMNATVMPITEAAFSADGSKLTISYYDKDSTIVTTALIL